MTVQSLTVPCTVKFFKNTNTLPLFLQSSLHPTDSAEAPGCPAAGTP